jgi:hypothetical protein
MSSGKPLPDLFVTIHRYASIGDTQQDLENSLRSREAGLPQKKIYKGAALYTYHTGGGTLICEDGLFVIEINPGNNARPFVMKVLDVVLDELNSISSKSK